MKKLTDNPWAIGIAAVVLIALVVLRQRRSGPTGDFSGITSAELAFRLAQLRALLLPEQPVFTGPANPPAPPAGPTLCPPGWIPMPDGSCFAPLPAPPGFTPVAPPGTDQIVNPIFGNGKGGRAPIRFGATSTGYWS